MCPPNAPFCRTSSALFQIPDLAFRGVAHAHAQLLQVLAQGVRAIKVFGGAGRTALFQQGLHLRQVNAAPTGAQGAQVVEKGFRFLAKQASWASQSRALPRNSCSRARASSPARSRSLPADG